MSWERICTKCGALNYYTTRKKWECIKCKAKLRSQTKGGIRKVGKFHRLTRTGIKYIGKGASNKA